MLVRPSLKRVSKLNLGIHAWAIRSLFIKHVGLVKCEINYKHAKIREKKNDR